jgi:predicted alpha/beta hydrolase family esterase
MVDTTVLIVPGLRDHVPDHWQTILAGQMKEGCRLVPPMGRTDLECSGRVNALDEAAMAISGPLVVVAHSAGAMTLVHWAKRMRRDIRGALLAAPADLETPMPDGYPTRAELSVGGWLPVPRTRLPFRTIVAASRNDPLASFERVSGFASDWGAELVDLGKVGHLNPGSGYGPWPGAVELLAKLEGSQGR